MKTLLVAARANPERWAELFRAALPHHTILTRTPEDADSVAYVVVGRPEPGLIAGLPALELVLSLNAGVEHLLAAGETPARVPIVRMVDEGLVEGMVEWVCAQLLSWHRHLPAYEADQAVRAWTPRAEGLARDKTVCVLGAGALGGPVASMLAALGFRTRVWSRTPKAFAGIESYQGEEGFAAALAGSDVLINLLPLTAQTENLLDGRALGRLRNGALLINAGRGGSLVDEDVLAALDAGKLSKAVLDVFRQEPLAPDHPFWGHGGVAISPHVAAPTHPESAVASMARTVRRYESGEPLVDVVDRSRGY